MSTTFKPRTYAHTIYQGDDYALLGDLRDRIERARSAESTNRGVTTLDDVPESVALVEEYNSLVVAAQERAAVVTLTALPRKQWRALVADHPPREGNTEDESVGVNEETFPDALVPKSITSIDPPQGDRDAFLEALSDAQFGELYQAAFILNRTSTPAPKALFVPSPSSDET